MVVLRKAPTNNRIIEDGSNYKTRGEWKENSGSLYAYALKDKELFRLQYNIIKLRKKQREDILNYSLDDEIAMLMSDYKLLLESYNKQLKEYDKNVN